MMPAATPNRRQAAIVMINTRKKSSNCHWLIQLPSALSTPGAISNLWPGGRFSVVLTWANRVSHPVTGKPLCASVRPIATTATFVSRTSIPVLLSPAPTVINRLSSFSVALNNVKGVRISRRQSVRIVPLMWSSTVNLLPSNPNHMVRLRPSSFDAVTTPRLRSVTENTAPGLTRNAGNACHSPGVSTCDGSTGGNPSTAVTRRRSFDR